MKTAEEIAEEVFNDWAEHGGNLVNKITKAVLADRAERDKRVIEVLDDAIAAENRIGYAAHTKLSALLAELRKGEK